MNRFSIQISIANIDNFFLTIQTCICAANVIPLFLILKIFSQQSTSVLITDGDKYFEEPYLGSMFKKTSYAKYIEHIYMFSA